jgi:acylphosphatase
MAKELIISGKVQGVFCRRYCSENAKKIGLGGSATNLSNGTVRVIINSDEENVINKYIQALKQNPFGFTFYGRIDDISVSEYTGPSRGDYTF